MEAALDSVENSLERLLSFEERGDMSSKRYATLAFAVASLAFTQSLIEETDCSSVKELIQTEVKPVLKAAATRSQK